MLYNLLFPYVATSHFANLLHYITFRCTLAVICSLAICLIFGKKIINRLKKCQGIGQPIRDCVSHQNKIGTPTMGGVLIIIAILVSSLLFADLTNPYVWIVLFVLVSLGILGFLDDYLKIKQKHHQGIAARTKLLIQITISVVAYYAIQYSYTIPLANYLTFPFFKNLLLNLGHMYLPFAVMVIIGSSNAVNLTDGLDGLAIVPIGIVVGCLGIISYAVGHNVYANYLQIIHIPKMSELTVVCSAITGASIGFLWFNAKPAEVFMGDTGSLSLGGVIGVISIIIKQELTLSILGGLFVIETLSVIMQVCYFKLTKGKRIFLMAPIHHHFEKLGWPESKIVIRFWIAALIFALLGLCSLKIR